MSGEVEQDPASQPEAPRRQLLKLPPKSFLMNPPGFPTSSRDFRLALIPHRRRQNVRRRRRRGLALRASGPSREYLGMLLLLSKVLMAVRRLVWTNLCQSATSDWYLSKLREDHGIDHCIYRYSLNSQPISINMRAATMQAIIEAAPQQNFDGRSLLWRQQPTTPLDQWRVSYW